MDPSIVSPFLRILGVAPIDISTVTTSLIAYIAAAAAGGLIVLLALFGIRAIKRGFVVASIQEPVSAPAAALNMVHHQDSGFVTCSLESESRETDYGASHDVFFDDNLVTSESLAEEATDESPSYELGELLDPETDGGPYWQDHVANGYELRDSEEGPKWVPAK